MDPAFSPNPIWNAILVVLSCYFVVHLFVLWPLAYFLVGRPFDREFTIKYYTIEKGPWFIGPGIRLAHYVFGIVLQSFRYKDIKSKLFSEIVKRRFAYQDKMYGTVIDFRQHASKMQLILVYIFWYGTIVLFIAAILLLLHNFILYPEFAKAKMEGLR